MDTHDQQRRFLHALFDGLPGLIEVRPIKPDGPARQTFHASVDEAVTAARAAEAEGLNVYAGVATRAQRSGSKRDLRALRALWVDVDSNVEDARAALARFEPSPSMVVETGGGVHAYWLLREPIDLRDEARQARVEQTLKGLCDALGADRAATDASRVLRVPGTTNRPTAAKRAKGRTEAPCSLGSVSAGRYDFEDFASFEERGRELAIGAERESYESSPWDGKTPASVEELLETDGRIAALFRREQQVGDGSDSAVDFALACRLAERGVPPADVENALRASRSLLAGGKRKHAGYFSHTVKAALARVAEAERADARGYAEILRRVTGEQLDPGLGLATLHERVPPRTLLPEATDTGFGEFFADHWGPRHVLFVEDERRWRGFDGRRWTHVGASARLDASYREMRETLRQLRDHLPVDVLVGGGSKPRTLQDVWGEHVYKLGSNAKVQAVIKRAQPRITVTARDFDADAQLLNVENGILDLETGVLRPHDPFARMAKVAAAEWHPGARDALWEAFLERVLPADLAALLQEYVGTALVGDVPEKHFAFLLGPTDSGKTTFINAVAGMLGDYALATRWSKLAKAERGAADHNSALAKLDGVRLAHGSEGAKKGTRVDLEIVKNLTGREEVSTRDVYQDEKAFRPQSTLLFAANRLSDFDYEDVAAWKRLLPVEFPQSIPAEEQDRGLGTKLASPGARAAILAWTFEGLRRWRERGHLAVPERVVAARDAHRAKADPLALWMAERVEPDPASMVDVSVVYDNYAGFTRPERPVPRKEFNDRMEGRGFSQDRVDRNRRRVWRGLRLCIDDGTWVGGPRERSLAVVSGEASPL